MFCFAFGNRAFTALVHSHHQQMPRRQGWVVFAAAAGMGLTVAAISLVRRAIIVDRVEFDGGYNALAPLLDPRVLRKI
jgi:hypothetical protein